MKKQKQKKLTVAAVAKMRGVVPKTVYKWINDGLPVAKRYPVILIEKKTAENWEPKPNGRPRKGESK